MSHEALIDTLREETLARMDGQSGVLLVQDTTSFDFSRHPAVKGLGELENAACRGFFVHSTLAVSAEGVPLGIVAQQVWVRTEAERGKRAKRHERRFEDKESYKWVDGLQARAGGGVWAEGITVCDREGHIYEFLAVLSARQQAFIVRGASGRSFTPEGEELFEAMAWQPVVAQMTLQLKRRPDREAREATLQLRFGSLTVRRPRRVEHGPEALTVQVVEVIECQPPEAEEPVHWVLLTSLPVADVPQARHVLTCYTYRWLIERFHYTLKSGCKLEESQLREAQRLERLLAVYSAVAWQLLWLTYQARQTPEVPCTSVLRPIEWQALFAFIQRTRRLPETPPSLGQVVRWIAQLGGFLGRKGDGEPGVKVLWRGWQRLQDITATWSIPFPPPHDVGNA